MAVAEETLEFKAKNLHLGRSSTEVLHPCDCGTTVKIIDFPESRLTHLKLSLSLRKINKEASRVEIFFSHR